MALAYIMFFFVDVKSFVNHGEILNPIVHISSFELTNKSGEIIPEKELTYKWRLISFVAKDCDQQCETRLFDTRQIHTSLGKNQHRLSRMFVHLEPAGDSFSTLIAESHPDVIHVNGHVDIIIKALGDNIRDDASITNNETYIMDPMGSVMMRVTQYQPSKEFLYDWQLECFGESIDYQYEEGQTVIYNDYGYSSYYACPSCMPEILEAIQQKRDFEEEEWHWQMEQQRKQET